MSSVKLSKLHFEALSAQQRQTINIAKLELMYYSPSLVTQYAMFTKIALDIAFRDQVFNYPLYDGTQTFFITKASTDILFKVDKFYIPKTVRLSKLHFEALSAEQRQQAIFSKLSIDTLFQDTSFTQPSYDGTQTFFVTKAATDVLIKVDKFYVPKTVRVSKLHLEALSVEQRQQAIFSKLSTDALILDSSAPLPDNTAKVLRVSKGAMEVLIKAGTIVPQPPAPGAISKLSLDVLTHSQYQEFIASSLNAQVLAQSPDQSIYVAKLVSDIAEIEQDYTPQYDGTQSLNITKQTVDVLFKVSEFFIPRKAKISNLAAQALLQYNIPELVQVSKIAFEFISPKPITKQRAYFSKLMADTLVESTISQQMKLYKISANVLIVEKTYAYSYIAKIVADCLTLDTSYSNPAYDNTQHLLYAKTTADFLVKRTSFYIPSMTRLAKLSLEMATKSIISQLAIISKMCGDVLTVDSDFSPVYDNTQNLKLTKVAVDALFKVDQFKIISMTRLAKLSYEVAVKDIDLIKQKGQFSKFSMEVIYPFRYEQKFQVSKIAGQILTIKDVFYKSKYFPQKRYIYQYPTIEEIAIFNLFDSTDIGGNLTVDSSRSIIDIYNNSTDEQAQISINAYLNTDDTVNVLDTSVEDITSYDLVYVKNSTIPSSVKLTTYNSDIVEFFPLYKNLVELTSGYYSCTVLDQSSYVNNIRQNISNLPNGIYSYVHLLKTDKSVIDSTKTANIIESIYKTIMYKDNTITTATELPEDNFHILFTLCPYQNTQQGSLRLESLAKNRKIQSDLTYISSISDFSDMFQNINDYMDDWTTSISFDLTIDTTTKLNQIQSNGGLICDMTFVTNENAIFKQKIVEFKNNCSPQIDSTARVSGAISGMLWQNVSKDSTTEIDLRPARNDEVLTFRIASPDFQLNQLYHINFTVRLLRFFTLENYTLSNLVNRTP